jgi:AcrR family transcriptional regulator
MPRQKPETRERVRSNIEGAALTLLSRVGWESTGMREIAAEAGMSPASLYNHYKSKEALFSALVERYQGRVRDESVDNPLRDYLKDCAFPHDMGRLADALEAVVVRDRAYLVLWYVDLLHFDAQHFRKQLAPTLLLETPELQARLKELKRSGALRGDPETLFKMVYVHLFNFFLTLHVFDGGKFFGGEKKKKDYLRFVIDTFLHGILNDDAPPAEKRAKAKKRASAKKRAG